MRCPEVELNFKIARFIQGIAQINVDFLIQNNIYYKN